MSNIREAVLMWSGGKDALLTLDTLAQGNQYAVTRLLTTVLEEAETVRMHGVPLALIEAQAEALKLPLHVMHVPPMASNATYEEQLERTLAPLLAEGVSMVATGDLFLNDIREYRSSLVKRLGAEPLFPVWERDTGDLARHFIERGYRAVITSVDITQLDPAFVGRKFDTSLLDDLPGDVDPCGENGEFHTFVYGGPLFSAPLDIEVGKASGVGRMRYASLRLAET